MLSQNDCSQLAGFFILVFFEMCSLNPEHMQVDGVSADAPAREDSTGESERRLRRLLAQVLFGQRRQTGRIAAFGETRTGSILLLLCS